MTKLRQKKKKKKKARGEKALVFTKYKSVLASTEKHQSLAPSANL